MSSTADNSSSWRWEYGPKKGFERNTSVYSLCKISLKNDIFLVKGGLKFTNKRQMAQANYLASLSFVFLYMLDDCTF